MPSQQWRCQHVKPEIRIHGVVTGGGGVPNVVPQLASCRFRVRALDAEELESVFRRVVQCAEGGALTAGSCADRPVRPGGDAPAAGEVGSAPGRTPGTDP